MKDLFLIGGQDSQDLFANGRFDPLNTTVINVKGIKSDVIFAELREHENIFVFSDLKPNPDFNIHSGTLFNHLMYKVIEEGVTGKKVIIMRDFNLIQWKELRKGLVNGCFRGSNTLFYYKDGEPRQVDIDKLMMEELI